MYLNPYTNQNFFGFFAVLFHRIWLLLRGTLSFESLVSDEIQILVLMGISVSAAFIGTFLVLRKMTMVANSLSHTILLGIAAVYLIFMNSHKNDPLELLTIPVLIITAFLTGLLTTFLTEFLTRVIKLQEDASIGLIFTSLFALGIVLVTAFSKNVHIGTELVMGNVDALQKGDIKMVFVVLSVNLILLLLFYNGFKITSFDPGLAKTLGFSPVLFNYLLMVQTSATVISSFRAVGVLMILAFLVMPVLAARMLACSLNKLIFVSILIGSAISIFGVALSRHLLSYYQVGLSTGGIVVTLLGLFYLCLAFWRLVRKPQLKLPRTL